MASELNIKPFWGSGDGLLISRKYAWLVVRSTPGVLSCPLLPLGIFLLILSVPHFTVLVISIPHLAVLVISVLHLALVTLLNLLVLIYTPVAECFSEHHIPMKTARAILSSLGDGSVKNFRVALLLLFLVLMISVMYSTVLGG